MKGLINPTNRQNEIHTIYSDNGWLNFGIGKVASVEEFNNDPRDLGSVFDDSLEKGDYILLKEGVFRLDDELNLIHPESSSPQ